MSTCIALELLSEPTPQSRAESSSSSVWWYVLVSAASPMGNGQVGWDADGMSATFVFCRSLRRGGIVGLSMMALVTSCDWLR